MTTGDDQRRPPIEATDEALARWARRVQMVSFPGPTAPGWLLEEIAAGVGAVCLFAGNIESDDAVVTLVDALRRARPDVVITIDEEGGDVTRLDQRRGSAAPGAAVLGAVDDVAATAATHRVIGRRLAALGIDVDLAPVADVNVAAENPVIGVRSFGDDPHLVARHVAAAVDALQSAGVAACLKHFPGHGATTDDSHQALPALDVDAATLRARELVPFAGTAAAAVMTAHIVVPALDERPATLSPAVLGLLRDELGFDGVVVSDALDMAGVHGPDVRYGEVSPEMIGAAAVAAVAAGCDLLCLGAGQSHDVPLAVTAALVAAVGDGRLAADRLADAAGRVERLARSRRWRIHGAGSAADDPQPTHDTEPTDGDTATAGDEATDGDTATAGDEANDRALVAGVAARAITVGGALTTPVLGALVVDCRAEATMANHDVPWGLGAALAAADQATRAVDATPSTVPAELLAAAADRPLVVTVRSAGAHRWQLELVDRLAEVRPDLVVVEMGWPAATSAYAGAALVRTFGASRASTDAVAALLHADT